MYFTGRENCAGSARWLAAAEQPLQRLIGSGTRVCHFEGGASRDVPTAGCLAPTEKSTRLTWWPAFHAEPTGILILFADSV
jgi:hypothetical protein